MAKAKPTKTRTPKRPRVAPKSQAPLPGLEPAVTNGAAGNGAATSRAQLSSLIKSSRDIMRKDAGLNGDLDRLPQLSWIIFLKCFDDLEERRETEAVMAGETYKPVIPRGYRWRDWAADPDKGRTGPDLITFVNDELLPKLRELSGSDERQVITEVFRETFNRMLSGYLLRDVVNLMGGVNFNSSDDIHTLSHLYESMLKEMRDAAGDSGEFYTPRPVVRFIVDRTAPKLGEKVLDPAAGTGGFLVETYAYLEKQQKTAADRRALQTRTLYGVEKKPMPYLLGVMNMLLHGVEYPHLSEHNALSTNIRQIRDDERVDVVATNPPFGGEEERGILNNFPDGMRTAETAILFFQYVMALLKRPGGRCGIVLPNGFLFGNSVAAIVKKQLLTRFNLHTIVRLPNGAFSPYTSIPTNLLFFEACDVNALDNDQPCTREVWYYELPLPERRSSYSKTKPLQYEEFADCIAWWDNRIENEHAWKVPVEQLLVNECNLDMKNPNSKKDFEHLPPEQLVKIITAKELRILEIMGEIEHMLARKEE